MVFYLQIIEICRISIALEQLAIIGRYTGLVLKKKGSHQVAYKQLGFVPIISLSLFMPVGNVAKSRFSIFRTASGFFPLPTSLVRYDRARFP